VDAALGNGDPQSLAEMLRVTLARQQGLLSAIPELIYLLSTDGTILERVSPDPTIDFVGPSEAISGRNVKQFGYAREKLQAMQAALATGQVQRFEQCICHGGVVRYEEVRIAPLNNHQLLYLARDISDFKRTAQALQEAHHRQSVILNTIPDLMFVVGADGRILERVTERPDIDLFSNQDIIGRFIADINTEAHAPERAQTQMAAIATALATGQVQLYEQWIYEQWIGDGDSPRCEEVRCAPIKDDRCLLMFRDISDRKRVELALQASEERRRLALEMSQTGSWEFDVRTGEANWSDSHYRLMGLIPGEVPSQYLTWRDRVHPEDLEATEAAFKKALENHAPLEVEYRVIHPDGSIHWVLTRGRGIYAEDGTPSKMTGVMFDVSDRKHAELELQRLHAHLQVQATIDSLTQIANRRQFETVFAQTWPQHQRQRQPLALMMVDIDHFKAYNDYYGHPTGDRCLQQVANLLDQCVRRGSDLVARYGGEEFIILLPNTAEEGAITLAHLMQTRMATQAIAHAASTTVPYVTLSIGIAVVTPPYLESPSSAIAAADRALYQAKQIRNCYRLYRLQPHGHESMKVTSDEG
jgi:diguanylate cyclase (GGDEF)-like protein/PAS domain S-box-containing protein